MATKKPTAVETGRPWNAAGYFGERPLLPWSWARRRLEAALNYWVATTLPDGRPLSRPVWGLWLDETFYFSTGSRITASLSARADITVHLESGFEVVIVEGTATMLRDAAQLKRIAKLYNEKYHWTMDPEDPQGSFYAVRPRVAFGWLCEASGEDMGLFGMSATRWRFH